MNVTSSHDTVSHSRFNCKIVQLQLNLTDHSPADKR